MDDLDRIRALLGREPRGDFDVVVRAADGDPVVLRNAPLLHDGTPMPTRFWLVGATEVREVGRLEAAGGVRAAERAVDPAELAAAHERYAAERDAALAPDHVGPRPSGGVGGTRTGVKCLHAHYAHHLAGGDDPVGRWVADQLAAASVTGRARIEIDADEVRIEVGPDERRLPVGIGVLRVGGLDDADPPGPESLTNAIGLVSDHLDDVVRELPAFADVHEVVVEGPVARSIARVEVGADDVELPFVLDRAAAEDVFRTVATESRTDRAHNPGLPTLHVDDIVAGCCILVAVMRSLHLDRATVG